MIPSQWDRRIRRANELTSSYSFAAEGLRYYSRVATFQRSLYGDIERALADSPAAESSGSLRDELDLFLLLPNFPRFLALIEQIARTPLVDWRGKGRRAGSARLRIFGTAIWTHLWLAAESTRSRRVRRPRSGRVNNCWRGFFCSLTRSILPISARRRLWMARLRLVRCAAGSRSWECCAARARARKNR